jgi:hypothetical protein
VLSQVQLSFRSLSIPLSWLAQAQTNEFLAFPFLFDFLQPFGVAEILEGSLDQNAVTVASTSIARVATAKFVDCALVAFIYCLPNSYLPVIATIMFIYL